MTVITRFAPSPTGYLHIGAARTALFNWLFARHCGGEFLLRIEDTDRARSTQAAVDAIIEGMNWLGLTADRPPIFQFERAARHAEAARQLLEAGKAYQCYASPAELDEMRARQRAEGKPVRYDGRWRDRDPAEAPAGVAPVIRLKAPQEGETVIHDLVQGEVRVGNEQLDDMVLLRGDGTPTYMLAVVVDDHDMGISHVIRGSDHLTNTFRQYQLYRALDWPLPAFAHIPLIHGADGAKLSKRHGALGIEAYREQGFLPEAMCNYLLRLGWGHGDDEIIPREQAVQWFGLAAVGRAPARFDLDRLLSLNAHYLRQTPDAVLAEQVLTVLRTSAAAALSPAAKPRLERGMPSLKERAKTLVDLAENGRIYAFDAPIPIGKAAADLLTPEALGQMSALREVLVGVGDWSADELERVIREFAARDGAGGESFRNLAQRLRAAVTGSKVSPPIFEVIAILGREETMARLRCASTLPVDAAAAGRAHETGHGTTR